MVAVVQTIWRPLWDLQSRYMQLQHRQSGWYIWPSSTWHALNLVMGGELIVFIIVELTSLVMIYPLYQNVLIAAQGITVLETMVPSAKLDHANLPDSCVGCLPLGAFSRGSRFSNLRALLGPRWKWRLILPVRGSSDVSEEASLFVTAEVADALRKH